MTARPCSSCRTAFVALVGTQSKQSQQRRASMIDNRGPQRTTSPPRALRGYRTACNSPNSEVLCTKQHCAAHEPRLARPALFCGILAERCLYCAGVEQQRPVHPPVCAMFSLIGGLLKWLCSKQELNMLIVGLDHAGKTVCVASTLNNEHARCLAHPGVVPRCSQSSCGGRRSWSK